jgi:iron complex transport system substrate-binding protein
MRIVAAAASVALGLAWLVASLTAQAQVSLVDDRGRSLTLPKPPQRVVSLLPSLTETVCALQACGRLVGVDRYADWPAQVRTLPRLGGLEDTQIERIVALKPDLVLAAVSSRAVDRLEALGVPVLALEPQSLADTRRMVQRVALALGVALEGDALLAQIDTRIAAAAQRVPPAWRGRKLYVEVAAAPYAAGEASFIGELLTLLGLANVVPASLGPFPQLNPEFVLRAQPDVVVASARALADMPARPGWGALKALQARHSCGLAPAAWDALVRPGPRLGEAADALADCLVGLGGPGSPGRIAP